jgi:hypothetical protein
MKTAAENGIFTVEPPEFERVWPRMLQDSNRITLNVQPAIQARGYGRYFVWETTLS